MVLEGFEPMPPNDAALMDFRDFYVLAPELTLAAWGLLVLLVDVGLLRGKSSARAASALLPWAVARARTSLSRSCRSRSC